MKSNPQIVGRARLPPSRDFGKSVGRQFGKGRRYIVSVFKRPSPAGSATFFWNSRELVPIPRPDYKLGSTDWLKDVNGCQA
ncbi:MAG: hypothetical protein ACK40X_14050 [Armatimonadota bacterium]